MNIGESRRRACVTVKTAQGFDSSVVIVKPPRMIFALGWLSAAWAQEPKPADTSTRLGIHFEPIAAEKPASPIFNPSPASGVIELPRFDVKEKPANLDPEELLSEQGRLDAAKKRFISPLYAKTFGPLAQVAEYYLNFFSLLGGWHPNDAEALVLYDQDLRLKRMKSFDDLLTVSKVASPDEAKELLVLRNESFRRDQPNEPEGAHPTFYFRRPPPRH